jgi:Exostosin family
LLITGQSSTPAQVYLLPPAAVADAAPALAASCYQQLVEWFPLQAATAHTLVDDPEPADLIIAAVQQTAYGPCFERLRNHIVYRMYAHKLVVYCPDDNQFPAIRGLYPSVSRQWVARGWALPAHYVSAHIHRFQFATGELQEKDVLFSFIGSSRTHPVRERIIALHHPGGVVIDSSPKGRSGHWWEQPNPEEFRRTFKDVTRRSQFVICPRGLSPSSIRLFEAMEAAAVPVIVSDAMELPRGPDWDTFSIRVAEKDVDSIPTVVEKLQHRAAEMGRAARQAWDTFFSDRATVGSFVSWARSLIPGAVERPLAVRAAEYLHPRQLREKVRHRIG